MGVAVAVAVGGVIAGDFAGGKRTQTGIVRPGRLVTNAVAALCWVQN